MKSAISLACVLAFVVTGTTALQANWYSDNNCGNYEDTTYFSGYNCEGNYQGAGSGLFVTQDDGCSIYGCSDSGCNNCHEVGTYECVSYPGGTWFLTTC